MQEETELKIIPAPTAMQNEQDDFIKFLLSTFIKMKNLNQDSGMCYWFDMPVRSDSD